MGKSKLKDELSKTKTLKDVVFFWSSLDGKKPTSFIDENIKTMIDWAGVPSIPNNDDPTEEEFVEWVTKNQDKIVSNKNISYDGEFEGYTISCNVDDFTLTLYI